MKYPILKMQHQKRVSEYILLEVPVRLTERQWQQQKQQQIWTYEDAYVSRTVVAKKIFGSFQNKWSKNNYEEKASKHNIISCLLKT